MLNIAVAELALISLFSLPFENHGPSFLFRADCKDMLLPKNKMK